MDGDVNQLIKWSFRVLKSNHNNITCIILIKDYSTTPHSHACTQIWKPQFPKWSDNFIDGCMHKLIWGIIVFLVPFADTIGIGISVILKGVDLIDHTHIFLLRIINHCVILILCILSWFVLTETSSEFFSSVIPPTEIS